MYRTTSIFLNGLFRGWFDGGMGGRSGDWHMMDWGHGLFFPGGFFIIGTGIALLLLLIWAIRSWGNRATPATVGVGADSSGYSSPVAVPAQPTPPTSPPSVDTPLHALQMRYAQGEISRAEYETIRQDLLNDRPVGSMSVAEPAAQPDVVETSVADEETATVDTAGAVLPENTVEEATSEPEKRTDM